jgi:putative ABC transport system permease protein
MTALAQDCRFAARILVRNPGFAGVAVLTLALGIGPNAAIFSVVNVALLHPLPYEQPERLALVTTVDARGREGGAQPADFLDWRAQSRAFESMAAKVDWSSYRLAADDGPIEVVGSPVSAAFFPMLRVQPLVGRAFLESEDRPGAPAVALIGEQLWETRFGRDPAILGRRIAIDGKPFTIAGVMPAGFSLHETRGESRDQLWIPFAQEFDARKLAVRDEVYQLRVWARLKPGVSIEQAQAEMDVIARRLERQFPDTNTGRGIRVRGMEEALLARVRPQTRLLLEVLLGTVGFVLLISCANVANLLLGRAATRRREIAVRMALGAGAARVARMLLTESLLLSALGGAAGLLLAAWGIRALGALAPADLPLPRLDQLRIDRHVVLFTTGVSILTALLFGAVPALQTARTDFQQALRGAGADAGVRRWFRSSLVVCEVAVSLVLLAATGLFLTTFLRLLWTDTGISTRHVLTLRVPAPDREMQRFERHPFYDELVRRVGSLPGVRTAAVVSPLPFTGGERLQRFDAGQTVRAAASRVTPAYFDALGIPVRAGRGLSEADTAGAPFAVVINETMARRYWPGENPVGRQLRETSQHDRILPDDAVATIVGVAADSRQRLETDPVPQVYFPFAQAGGYGLGTTLVVRAAGPALPLAGAVRERIRTLDPSQPAMDPALLDEVAGRSVAPQRFNMVLFSMFALIALGLACAGIYGVTSLSTTQRTREFGIRMALGARWRDIAGLVLRQGLRDALIGVALGLAGTFGLTRFVASQLYGTSPTDPLTFAAVSLIVIAVTAAACYVPARRAARVDPAASLRHE